MRKNLVFLSIAALILLMGVETKAQSVSVVSVSSKNDVNNFYTMMKEAFPLAYSDPAAPRFIFFDKDQRFIFGIGGYVQATGVYDFNGVQDYNYFTTSTIAPKGHQPGSSYGMTIGQSRLFFKLIGNTGAGQLVTYMEMEFEGPSQTPILQQAFVQFRGFKIGKAWSTFGDMSAIPTTIDEEGPSSGIETRQLMVRYTHDFNKRWQASLALEYVVPDYTNQSNDYTQTIRQRIPDVPLNVRYSFNNGSHLQASGIFRDIYYKNNIKDKDEMEIGWGAALSGSVKLMKNTQFLFQGVYGKGIANYIQDMGSLGYDLIPSETNGKLEMSKMWGAFGAIQQNWCESMYSTIVYSYARMEKEGAMPGSSYKYAQYAAANLLWNFCEYGTTGVEYVFGRRNNFDGTYGNASRINAMIQYRF